MTNVRWSSRVDLTTWQTRSEGRFRQSRKPLYARAYRAGSKSHSLRHITCNLSVFQEFSSTISMRSHIEAHGKALPDAHGPKQLAACLSCSPSPPASHHDRGGAPACAGCGRSGSANDGGAGHQLVSRHRAPQCGRQYPRPPNRRAVGSGLDFSLTIAPTAESRESRARPRRTMTSLMSSP